ncbi:MAG: hypothetical protein ACP5VE_14470 [Chthonomonadales bacterium]
MRSGFDASVVYCNARIRFTRRIRVAACVLACVTACAGSAVSARADEDLHARIVKDLAARLKVPANNVRVFKTIPMRFADGALGMPAEGRHYSAGPVAGEVVIPGYNAFRFLYMAGGDRFVFRGPLEGLQYSIAYLRTIPDEPNLNKDLVQATLYGTNPVLLFHAASDFYPQEDGSIIATRRTSRSGHELYYIGPEARSAPRKLRAAFDFGAAAVTEDGLHWAALERRGIGDAYRLIVGEVKTAGNGVKVFDLPAEGTPGRIEWDDRQALYAEIKRGEEARIFTIEPLGEQAAWKESTSGFPSDAAWMLNKSELARVRQDVENGIPTARVERVWFTGARALVASIADLKFAGATMHFDRFVFLWGRRKDDTQSAATVDLLTHLVIPVEALGVSHFRFLNRPPAGAPITLKRILADP